MKNQTFYNSLFSAKHWYLSLILGVLFIAIGIWVLMTPLQSFITLAMFFSFTFFVNGILEIIYYLSNRNTTSNWGWGLIAGIFDLLFGLWLITSPQVSVEILPIYIGIMLLFRSLTAIAIAIELHGSIIKSWGWLLFIGILGTVFSFMMIWNPLFGGMTIIFWTAWAFISVGVFRIFLSFNLRSFKNHINMAHK